MALCFRTLAPPWRLLSQKHLGKHFFRYSLPLYLPYDPVASFWWNDSPIQCRPLATKGGSKYSSRGFPGRSSNGKGHDRGRGTQKKNLRNSNVRRYDDDFLSDDNFDGGDELSLVRSMPRSAMRNNNDTQGAKFKSRRDDFRSAGNSGKRQSNDDSKFLNQHGRVFRSAETYPASRQRNKQGKVFPSAEKSTATHQRNKQGKIFPSVEKKLATYQRNTDDNDSDDELIHPKRMFREDWIEEKKKKKKEVAPKIEIPTTEVTEDRYNRAKKGARAKRREVLGQKLPERKKTQKSVKKTPVTSKHFPPNELNIFVSCIPGLEPILAEEMQQLGHDCRIEAGGVTPTNALTKDDIFQLHLHLGSASHVLIRCGAPFTSHGLKHLRYHVGQMPWRTLLSKRGQPRSQGDEIQLRVKVTTKKSKLHQKTAIRTAVVNGINDSLPDNSAGVIHVLEAKEDTMEESISLPLIVRIENDEVVLSLDSSSTPLHRRGYRLATAKAPLREDLAFAIVHSAGWCRKGKASVNHQSLPVSDAFTGFLDPFCGSGTIAIEAAAMACGLPPGRLRPPPLAGTVMHKPQRWQNALDKVQIQRDKLPLIAASDRDAGAIVAAKSNAKRAGVDDVIQFQCEAIRSHPWFNHAKKSNKNKTETGDEKEEVPSSLLVATNPPFGLRIVATSKDRNSRVHKLLPLYQTLVQCQERFSSAGNSSNIKSMTIMALLHDLRVFRQTGAKNMSVQWSSQHGGLPVAAAWIPPPPSNNDSMTVEAPMAAEMEEIVEEEGKEAVEEMEGKRENDSFVEGDSGGEHDEKYGDYDSDGNENQEVHDSPDVEDNFKKMEYTVK